jgi:hypothetical protein
MNQLLRSSAPISDAGWELLDAEARERLTSVLAARKLVDFSGPHGWEHSASNLGRTRALGAPPCEGVSGLQRAVLALVELRADFELSRVELRDADRGAADTDLGALDRAAHQIGVAENRRVSRLEGRDRRHRSLPYKQVRLGAAPYPRRVAGAVEQPFAWYRRPVRFGARTRSVPARRRDRRAAATVAGSPAQDLDGRSCGHRA